MQTADGDDYFMKSSEEEFLIKIEKKNVLLELLAVKTRKKPTHYYIS